MNATIQLNKVEYKIDVDCEVGNNIPMWGKDIHVELLKEFCVRLNDRFCGFKSECIEVKKMRIYLEVYINNSCYLDSDIELKNNIELIQAILVKNGIKVE